MNARSRDPAGRAHSARSMVLLVVAVLLVLAGCGGGGSSPQASRLIPVGERVAAPVLRGELIGGGAFDLGAHRGDVVLINFWASYCAPCRTEAPELEAVYAATKAEGVTFLGINVRDQRDAADRFLATTKPTYGSLFDPAAELSLEFDVPPNALPATLLVDRAGRLAAVFRSAVDRELLEPVVRDLVAEPAGG